MAEDSKIEWCDHTFNPWLGCTKISPACDHCYAETWANRFDPSLWQGERRRTSPANWSKPFTWDRKAKAAGERHRVFCASLADVFDNQVPRGWRDDLFGMISGTPNLDWLLLTKRPQNIAKMLPADWGSVGYDNVWLGTTVENQYEAERRIPALAEVPAIIRFLSCEPMLGPIHLPWARGCSAIDWVICGGESGPGAREIDPTWARILRDDCAATGKDFFMKQMSGTRKPLPPIPNDLAIRQFPVGINLMETA